MSVFASTGQAEVSHPRHADRLLFRSCVSSASPLAFLAQIVGDRFGHGIDDTHIKIRGAPVLDEAALDAHQKMIADKLQARDAQGMPRSAAAPVYGL